MTAHLAQVRIEVDDQFTQPLLMFEFILPNRLWILLEQRKQAMLEALPASTQHDGYGNGYFGQTLSLYQYDTDDNECTPQEALDASTTMLQCVVALHMTWDERFIALRGTDEFLNNRMCHSGMSDRSYDDMDTKNSPFSTSYF